MVPKNFRKNIKFLPQHIGPQRRWDMLQTDISEHGTFLPRPVMYEDLDKTFIEFVEKDLNLVINGQKVPVIFLTIQRWAEYTRTWKFTDEHKNIKIPFITVVRKPDVQVGTNQNGLWNIPGYPTWTYMQVPTWNGGREGMDLYKIPQPTSVDVNYEVRLFCNKMRDLNKFNLKIMQTFQSRQFYISPNGHPMPVHLESNSDESSIADFENRRFYVQLFNMKLLAYIINEGDFEVVPMPDRMLITTELSKEARKPSVSVNICGEEQTITLTVISKPASPLKFNYTSEYNMQVTTINLISNISNVAVKVNGVTQTVPFNVNAGDIIEFTLSKSAGLLGKFIIKGNLI